MYAYKGDKMIIAISTEKGQVCPHFGHAPEFTFVKIEDNKVIEKKIESSPGHQVGTIPKFIHDNNAQYIITGGAGPMAITYFKELGIEVILGVSGNIDDVIEAFLNGTLKSGTSSCTHN